MDDMSDWVSKPSSYGQCNQFGPEIDPEWDDQYSPEALDKDRGSLAWYLIPMAFFFMPGRFMRSCGVHLSVGLLFLIIWVTGISSMLNSLETRSLTGSKFVTIPDPWTMLAAMAIGGGIIRGFVIYGLGGLWYRLRLKMSGFDGADWKQTGRVYMVSGTIKHLFFVVYIAYESTRHDTYTAYLQDESGSWAFWFLYLGVVMMLQIFSSVTLFVGSVAVFPVKKLPAVFWMLVLPIIIRFIGLGLILLGTYFGNLVPEPKLDQPSKYAGDLISMEYPQNWTTREDDSRPGSQMWVQAVPLIGDAIFEAELTYPQDAEKVDDDIFDASETDWAERLEIEYGRIKAEKRTVFGGRECDMRERSVTIDGSSYTMRWLHWPVGDAGYGLLVAMLTESSSWDKALPAFRHMVSTMRVLDPTQSVPDTENTYTAKLEELRFELPINWWITTEVNEDKTREDGSVSLGTRFMEAQTPSWGYFQAHLYESNLGARAELGVSIEVYNDSGRLENEEPIGEWLGFSGFGVRGQSQLSDGRMWNIKIIVSPVSDGRLLELRRLVPVEFDEVYSPGFELIERTFELQLPDPESP